MNDVLEAHRKALEAGGRPGVLSRGLLESALGRAYGAHYRLVHERAAALVHSLAKNHGFVDGNKRTALLIMDQFLRRSGYDLDLEPNDRRNTEVEQMILDVVEDRIDFRALLAWFKARIRRL